MEQLAIQATNIVRNALGQAEEKELDLEVDIAQESAPCLISRASLSAMGGISGFPPGKLLIPIVGDFD